MTFNVEFDLNDYQIQAASTAIYPKDKAVYYPAMGLAGEAGEMLNKLKKTWRDDTEINEDALFKELGDCLWYVAAIATDMDWSLSSVAEANIQKLFSRQDRGVLGGAGDDR